MSPQAQEKEKAKETKDFNFPGSAGLGNIFSDPDIMAAMQVCTKCCFSSFCNVLVVTLAWSGLVEVLYSAPRHSCC